MTTEEARAFFLDNDNFLLASHESPDADGLGAQYALCLGLRGLGKNAIALNADKYSDKYRFIDEQKIIRHLEDPPKKLPDFTGYNLVLIDTNDIHYAGNIAVLAKESKLPVFIIDHHEPDNQRPTNGYIQTDASSCCEIVFRLLQQLDVSLSLDMAQALFSGIVYDTGSFAYSKTSSETFSVAMQLLKIGVKPDRIHRSLYESTSIQALLLKKHVLSTLELALDNKVAIQTMTRQTLQASGATYIDSEDIIDIPLQSKIVEISILFKESETGQLRCSLRGKGSINVAALAQSFGGGGHKNAAGFRSPLPLADIKDKMLSLLSEKF